jgi:hypothetical protein
LQSLCTHCHESRKQFEESHGFDRTIGIDGWPIDPPICSTNTTKR